jgi:hypothetical protein
VQELMEHTLDNKHASDDVFRIEDEASLPEDVPLGGPTSGGPPL